MSADDSAERDEGFSEKDPTNCRIETQGGTVYWLSAADAEGLRWIVREHLQTSDTNTMVVQKFSHTKDGLDLGDKFRGRLVGEVQPGMPFVIEVPEHETRILSEPVVAIEVGNVPEMIFR